MQYKVTIEEISTYEIEVEATTEPEASAKAQADVLNSANGPDIYPVASRLTTIDIQPPKLSVGIKDKP